VAPEPPPIGRWREGRVNAALDPLIKALSRIMQSLQGQLLIATSTLVDPNFAKAVVLIAVHGSDGALGLILNRELEMSLQDVWSKVCDSSCVRTEAVRHGGPVSGTLMALHDCRSMANVVVADDVYVATELNTMKSLVASVDRRALFYLGHAGWGPGQLEGEIEEGSWLLLPAREEHVFGGLDGLSLWKEATTDSGRRQLRALVEVRHAPENPRAN
jgi:putative transcriptional regulator